MLSMIWDDYLTRGIAVLVAVTMIILAMRLLVWLTRDHPPVDGLAPAGPVTGYPAPRGAADGAPSPIGGDCMRITINGAEAFWTDEKISYGDVVELARPDLAPGPYPLLSVTYSWRGEGDLRRDGILYPGSPPIQPAEGMRFSAYHTGNA